MNRQTPNDVTSAFAFAVDRRGKIAHWNQAAEKALGYPSSAALGQKCWCLLAGQDIYGNQFCHRHCSLRKMAFEKRQVNGCHLCIRTAFNGRWKYAIDSRLISDARGNDLLLHTCQPVSRSLKIGNGESMANGSAAFDAHRTSLQQKHGDITFPAVHQNGKIPERACFKPGIASSLEFSDLMEGWLNWILTEEKRPNRGLINHDPGFLDKLERVLEENHADPKFSLPELASEMYMCVRQLQRKLKDTAGHNPAEYLRRYRLKKARELLKTGKQVGLVADAVGFSSPAYFTSCFRMQFGQTPSDYRQQFQ
jgi:AraC-like DNA-binding protein